jgi:hypothetical protein
MSEQDYRGYYERLTDDQLRLVFSDRRDLEPEATVALDREIQRRKLGSPEALQWKPLPDTNQPAHCLDEYPGYQALTARKQLARNYAIPIGLAPFLLGLVLARQPAENSEAFILITLGWGILVLLFALSIYFRWLGFRCPQCSDSFGRGAECFSCGFPRRAQGK